MISFIVPFLNEEKYIVPTIQEIIKASSKIELREYEIILIDDFSSDNSVNLIEDFIKNQKLNIRLIRNSKNLGFGGSVKIGIKNSKKNYSMWIPGDNPYSFDEIFKIIKHYGNYDIVSSKYENPNARSKFRNTFTKIYTPLLNFVFNLNLPYYCGVVLCRSEIAQNIKVSTNSHFFQIEFWVKNFLYKKNLTFKFEPLKVKDKSRRSNSFNIKNIIKVIYNFFKLLFYSLFYRLKIK